MYKPVKPIQVELNDPIPFLGQLQGYAALRVLVRSSGIPLGYVDVPLPNGSCLKGTIAEAIRGKWGESLHSHSYRNGVEEGAEPRAMAGRSSEDAPGFSLQSIEPLVTIAVCTKDRPRELHSCLQALECLAYSNLDLLVVDNAPSNEETRQLVQGGFPALRYIREPRPGLNWARNRAIEEARGEIIAFTDDDAIPDAGWIKALVRCLEENPRAMAATGLVFPSELETEPQFLFEEYWGFGKGFERKIGTLEKDMSYKVRYHCCCHLGTGANMAFRRKIFEKIGSFDPALDAGTPTGGGGDLEMFFRLMRAGYELIYEPGAIVFHRHRPSRKELLDQMKAWGSGFFAYLLRTGVHYPEERPGTLRFGMYFLWRRYIRRCLLCVGKRYRPLGPYCLAELRGALAAPLLYAKAIRKSCIRSQRNPLNSSCS
jgi:O-antigen biosynthesis protein